MFLEMTRLRRRGEGRRLSTRILVSQLVILAVTSVIGFVLFAWAQRAQLDKQYENRALSIARTAAAAPEIRAGMARGVIGGAVQQEAQLIAHASGARYVVVIDLNRVR